VIETEKWDRFNIEDLQRIEYSTNGERPDADFSVFTVQLDCWMRS
jgi:hypothetical protein